MYSSIMSKSQFTIQVLSDEEKHQLYNNGQDIRVHLVPSTENGEGSKGVHYQCNRSASKPFCKTTHP